MLEVVDKWRTTATAKLVERLWVRPTFWEVGETEIWLETFKVADKGSLSETDIKQALKVIKENQALLIESFNNVKAGKKITTIKIK